jgi:flagellar protein FlaG
MIEVNRTEPIRPVTSQGLHMDVEVSQADTQAAMMRQPGGNDVPPIPAAVESATNAAENALAIRAQVEAVVSALNEYARKSQRNLEFSVDAELDRPVVRVMDASTGDVIRQIPSETALHVARNLQATLEQTEMQRAAQRAGSEIPGGTGVSFGLVNTHA